MKKINILLTTILIPSATLISASCSNEISAHIDLCVNGVTTADKIAWICFHMPEGKIKDLTISLLDNNDVLLVRPEKTKLNGRLLDVCLQFKEEHDDNIKFNISLDINFSLDNHKCKQTINNILIIYHKETELEKLCNNYAEANQMDALNSLTYNGHSFFEPWCENFDCDSMVDAVINYCYGPGWTAWNGKLHAGKGDTSLLDNDESEDGFFDPWNGNPVFTRTIKYNSYTFLDQALKSATVGNVPLPLYHGVEGDESEIIEWMSNKLEIDIAHCKPEEIEEAKTRVASLKNQKFIDYGYLATSFNFETSWAWTKTAEYCNLPYFIEITSTNPNANGLYASYSRQYYGGYTLAHVSEYELLFNRKIQFLIEDANILDPEDEFSKSVLYIKAKII